MRVRQAKKIDVLSMQVLSQDQHENSPNFGGGSPGFFTGGVFFFFTGVPDFCKQGLFYPIVPSVRFWPCLFVQSREHEKS